MKTPSIGIDQNQDLLPVDKYWGRVPIYLQRIPETINETPYVVTCNPEFIFLLDGFIDGTIIEENLSQELYAEIKRVIDLGVFYGVVPMPEYDALYKCWGQFIPPAPGTNCPLFFTKDSTYQCATFYTSDGSPLVVKP